MEFAAGPRFKSGVVLEQEIKEANAECPQPRQKARVTRDICTGAKDRDRTWHRVETKECELTFSRGSECWQ